VGTEYYLQGNDLSDIIEVCQLNHLKLSANNAEKQKFQEDTTSLIKKMYSVLVSVDIPILEKALGKLREDISIMDILCSEGMWEKNMSIYLNTDLSGKEQTEKYLKDLKYIISMVKKMITDWKISNSLISLLIESLLTQVKKLKTINEGQARFPANFIHDNSEEVRDTMMQDYQDPSRFFKSIIYQAKASKSERNKGCEELEEKEFYKMDNDHGNLGHFMVKKAGGEMGDIQTRKNNHPTVKPIALMEYLVKLVSKEGHTVLDPFMGSGTTGVACKRLKRNFIGIELSPEYIEIAQSRIDAEPEAML
jgi:DNA modification methylase